MARYQKQKQTEVGAIRKEWGGRVPIAVVYPNTYFVGMSNLAIHLLYKMLNADRQIVAERIFLAGRSLETGRPVSDFSVAAFSFSFEADYLNIPKVLGPNIGLLRRERKKDDPLLIAGGPAVTLNPAAIADIFDAIVVGEVEEILDEITNTLKEASSKDKRLEDLARIPGIFVPGITDEPKRIYTKTLDDYPTHSAIWTPDTEFGHMHLVEAQRGCPWSCRFCATPAIYSPHRNRGFDSIMESVKLGVPHRRHIGLIGADILGHPDFGKIADELIAQDIKLSPSSLRVNRITKEVASLLVKLGHNRATLGIEAGTESLRQSINKGLTDPDIFGAVSNLARAGIANLKLYYMVGLPDETEEDVTDIIRLTGDIREIILKERRSKLLAPNISVVVTPFVPKRLTPFSDRPFAGIDYLTATLKKLRSQINKIPNTGMTGESPRHALLEYTLSRENDRLLNKITNADMVGPKS